jgi:hypothetical protein
MAYVNFADKQFGVFDSTPSPQDLIGVPFFSTAANYSAGQPINYLGKLYLALGAVSSGAWNPAQWALVGSGGGGGGATIIAQDTPPVGAADNTLWLETDSGLLFVKWNDGNSSQWVAMGSGTSGAVLYSNQQALTVLQKAQARANINAPSLEALAGQNLIINGGPVISQEIGLGTTGGQTVSGGHYIADGWVAAASFGAPVTAVYWGTEPPSGGYLSNLVLSVNAAYPAPAAGDYFMFYQAVEGGRWARLGWGTANAQPISIGFWVSSQVSGTMSLAVKNAASTRAYCVPFSVPAGAAYVTMTIPGCVDGAWPTNNTMACSISFASMVGSTFMSPTANAWVSGGNYIGAPTQTNLHASVANAIRLWGVTVIPGTQPVPQDLAPLVSMRPVDQELLTCSRYFVQYGGVGKFERFGIGQCVNATNCYPTAPLTVPMRVAPTVSVSALTDWALSGAAGNVAITALALDQMGAQAISLSTASSGLTPGWAYALIANNTTNARLKLDARL